jgi:hypothetical protein
VHRIWIRAARMLSSALTLALLGALAAAQTYDASTRTVTVEPSGGDDTSAIRTAFDVCGAVGPGCTVRLTEGTFVTRQHVVQGFDGRFVGAGAERTFIEPLAPLRVTDAEMVLTQPPTDEEPWPILFLFVDARMTLADLGFRVRDPIVTTPWNIFGMQIEALATLVSLTGENVRVDVERIAMESGEGPFFGVNVINGLFVQGVLPGPSGGFDDRPRVSGTVTVRDSRFVGPDGGVLVENADGATVVIEGNEIDGVLSVYVQDVANGVVEIRGNDIATVATGVFLSAGGFYTPAAAARVLVLDNTVRVAEGATGVGITDAGETPTLQALVMGNVFHLADAEAAIGGTAQGVVVRDNVLRGSAFAGLRVGPAPRPETAAGEGPEDPGPSVGWWIGDNDATDFAATEATVWLTEFAERTVVVCGAAATLRDEGQGTFAACD